MKANGVILFDYAHTTPVYTTTLMAGAFNNTSAKKQVHVAQKKKLVAISQKKKEDKSKRPTVIKTTPKGTWIFTK
jgi:hypothetical protein